MDNSIQQKIGTINDWVYVRKDVVPPEVLESDLKVEVTINDRGYDMVKPYNLWDEIRLDDGTDLVAIPRYCPFALNLSYEDRLMDYTTQGDDIEINIKVPPRDSYQEEAIQSIINHSHGIIQAKTAFGKTYCAINAICRLKKRTLICMHKRELMKQWKDDILKYTDLKEDDIQIFSGGAKNFKKGKAITITTVQNLGAKVRLHNMDTRQIFRDENFGITFVDEVHTTIGPISNTQATRWIFSKRVYGLSATPIRGDSFDKTIRYTIGNIIYRDQRKLLPVYVAFAPVNLEIPRKTQWYLTNNTKMYTNKYAKYLAKNEAYTNYCTQIIEALMAHKKKVLVVCSHKVLLEKVYDTVLRNLIKRDEDVDKIRLVHGTSATKLDAIKSLTDEEIKNFSTLFSTNSFFSDGISVPWLDTIVYLTSPSSRSNAAIPQMVGRILRSYEGKRYVNVVDIFNQIFDVECHRRFKRVEAYGKLNYNILDGIKVYDPYVFVDQMIQQSEQSCGLNDTLIPFEIDDLI